MTAVEGVWADYLKVYKIFKCDSRSITKIHLF